VNADEYPSIRLLEELDPDRLFLYTVECPWPHVEGCVACGELLEVMPGERRVAACLFHLQEPDLFCYDCAAGVRPDLVEASP
jgi:hypothetical protein